MFLEALHDMSNKTTVGELIAAFLEQCGVKTAFGVISIHNMPILDAIGRTVERHLRLAAFMARLQHDAAPDGRQDVAGDVIVRAATEGDVGPNSSREIFLAHFRHTRRRVLAQRFARIYLVSSDPNVHDCLLPCLRRALRTAVKDPSTKLQAKRDHSGLTSFSINAR